MCYVCYIVIYLFPVITFIYRCNTFKLFYLCYLFMLYIYIYVDLLLHVCIVLVHSVDLFI